MATGRLDRRLGNSSLPAGRGGSGRGRAAAAAPTAASFSSIAPTSSGTPSPVRADMYRGGACPAPATGELRDRKRLVCGRSSLLTTVSAGRLASSSEYARSSARSSSRSRQGSGADPSTTSTSRRVLSRCLRQRRPRPAPEEAPLLRNDLGADRDPEHEVGPLAARLQPARARLPVARAPDPLAGVLGEVCQRAVGEQEDRSSASAVAPVGTASGREGLVPERCRAGAAAPTSNGDGGGVYESATRKP